MPRLFLNDGYTLEAETKPEYRGVKGLPTVTFAYRPAMSEAIYEWQWRGEQATSGADRLAADADLVAAHLVRWDVSAGSAVAPITPEVVRTVPNPILQQLVTAVVTWAAKEQADAAGNS